MIGLLRAEETMTIF